MAEVNRREIYRYLGIKGQQEPDLQTKDLVEDCSGRIRAVRQTAGAFTDDIR